jgi:hypothetical protein
MEGMDGLEGPEAPGGRMRPCASGAFGPSSTPKPPKKHRFPYILHFYLRSEKKAKKGKGAS